MIRVLSNKVIIVSGGTRGMGEACVRGFTARGAQVVFGGRDEAAGRLIAAGLDGRAIYSRHDVTSEEDWAELVAVALQRFGRVDGLANIAGVMSQENIAAVTEMAIDRLIAVNQIAVLLGMKHIVEPMRAGGGGSIVNVGSIAALRGMPGISAYSGTKAAVVGISRAAAMELAPQGIRVNVVHPGVFETRMLTEAMGAEGITYGIAATPLGRVGQPNEIVGPVSFLLSDDSSFVTGAVLSVDGGLSL